MIPSGTIWRVDERDDLDLHDLDARMRQVWRQERREVEREDILSHWQNRNLTDAAAEAMRRGDRVAVILPHAHFEGRVFMVGRDFAGLATQPGAPVVYIRLADWQAREREDPYTGPQLLFEVTERARSGGRESRWGPTTFQAVLHEFGLAQQMDFAARAQVEVGTTLPSRRKISGVLRAHAWDHCYIESNGAQLFLPVSSITYVTWSATAVR